MSGYVLASSVVLATSAWVFYKWSARNKRNSEVILRQKTVEISPRRVSAPERPRPRDETLKSDERTAPQPTSGSAATQATSTCAATCSSPSSASSSRLPSGKAVPKTLAELERVEATVTEILATPPGSPKASNQVPPVESDMSPTAHLTKAVRLPHATGRSTHEATTDRLRLSIPLQSPGASLKLAIPVESPSSPPMSPTSFPLSPSMAPQCSIPFTRRPDYKRHMRALIQEWTFMSSIRKKKLPLNKFGLPDVSADKLEGNTPRKKIIDKMRKAFRDLTEEKLISGWDDGSGFECVIDLFGQLLDLICSFVGRRQSDKFRKTLDIDMLKQMVKAHVYTPEEFQNTLKLCVGLLYELESPYQHTLTQEWWSELRYDFASKEEYAAAICDSIMYLFRKCDLCKMEVENYYISRITPAERQVRERVAFERIPLQLRTPWDCSTKESFIAGLVKIVAENTYKLKESSVTSCLACDLPALHSFQNSLQEATILSLMSVVLNKIFVKLDPDDVTEFFDTVLEAYYYKRGPDVIFDILKTRIPESDHAVAKEACAQIAKCADVSDPLYKVLRDRMVKFVADANAGPDVFGAKPAHLCHANQRGREFKDLFYPFVDEHWMVYGPCYENASRSANPKQ